MLYRITILYACCLFIARASIYAPVELVQKILGLILVDDGFKVPSPQAREALEAATRLLDWSKREEGKKKFYLFSKWLTVKLNACFDEPPRSWRARAEKMWKQFHQLRVSDTFEAEWDGLFHAALGMKALPTVYQYVSRQLMKALLEKQYATCQAMDETVPSPLTWQEENALRYVGGYVCRKVWKKISESSESSLPCKEEMLQVIIDLCGDEDGPRGTETWTNEVDRGGLWHISDEAYSVFLLLEDEVRRHFKVTTVATLDETTKRSIMDAILTNEDLLFQWSLVTAEADNSTSINLLERLGLLYLTVRGFSFATSCLELYKQRHKRQVQKSKALRREVKDSTTN